MPHLCKLVESTVLIINVEPYSAAGIKLNSFFNDNERGILFSKKTDLYKYFDLTASFEPENITITIAKHLMTDSKDKLLDERVLKIISHIKNHYQENLTIKELASLVFLSPSRMASLFKVQTGSSLSKFILWTRLRQAITIILANKELSLTEIAYETGFYDLPQLNKYMYEMIGVSPIALKQNRDLIQVY